MQYSSMLVFMSMLDISSQVCSRILHAAVVALLAVVPRLITFVDHIVDIDPLPRLDDGVATYH